MDYLSFLSLFGSIWFGLIVIIVSVIIIVNIVNEHPWAAFFAQVALVLIFMIGSFAAIISYVSIINILIYLGVGIIYSLFSVWEKSRKELRDSLSLTWPPTEDELQKIKIRVKNKVIKKTFAYVILWPAYILNWALTDLMGSIRDLFIKITKSIYGSIMTFAFSSIDVKTKEKEK